MNSTFVQTDSSTFLINASEKQEVKVTATKNNPVINVWRFLTEIFYSKQWIGSNYTVQGSSSNKNGISSLLFKIEGKVKLVSRFVVSRFVAMKLYLALFFFNENQKILVVWTISQFDTGKYQTIKNFEIVSIKVKSISATQPNWSNVLTIQEKILHSVIVLATK